MIGALVTQPELRGALPVSAEFFTGLVQLDAHGLAEIRRRLAG